MPSLHDLPTSSQLRTARARCDDREIKAEVVKRQELVACRRGVARTVVHRIRRVIQVAARSEREPDEASRDLQLVDADRPRERWHDDGAGARRSVVRDEQCRVLRRRPRTLVPWPDLIDINPNARRCSGHDARLRIGQRCLVRWRGGRNIDRRRTCRCLRGGARRRRHRVVRRLARTLVLLAGPVVGSGSGFSRLVRCPRAPQHRDQPRNRSSDHQSDRKKIAKPGYAWIAHEPPSCIVNKDVHRRVRTPWPSHHLSAGRQNALATTRSTVDVGAPCYVRFRFKSGSFRYLAGCPATLLHRAGCPRGRIGLAQPRAGKSMGRDAAPKGCSTAPGQEHSDER